MYNRVVTALLITVSLSGCVSSAISVEEAKKYAGLSVTSFLDARFVGDERTQKINGTYRYTAFFTETNIRYLLRPTHELQNFCTAQGGSAVRIQAHHGSPVGRYFTSPLMAGLQTDAHARSRGATDLVAGRASIIAMQHQQELNTLMGEHEARNGYAAAMERGVYGTWECRDALGTRKWSASVLPIAYRPRTAPLGTLDLAKEGAGTASILVEITPLAK